MIGNYHRIRIDIRILYCRNGGGSDSSKVVTQLGFRVEVMKGDQRVMQCLAALFGGWHPAVLPFAPNVQDFCGGHEHGAPTSAPRNHDGLGIRDGATCTRT